MPKANDKEIINEFNDVDKQFLLQQLRVMKGSEIVKYNYEKNVSLDKEYDYETITIVRRLKKINLKAWVENIEPLDSLK